MAANGTAPVEASHADAEPTAIARQDFPVDSFREAARELRRPFTPAAVKFKPQQKIGNQTLCVAYIDARLVIDRLNLIVADGWTAEYEPVAGGLMWCHLTVCGVTRRDVGEGKGKALLSDSLKRAAVHFGVGVSIYAIPSVRLPGEIKYVTDQHTAQLRQRYERWLTQTGIPHFGEPLDHGDADDGGQGDPDEPAPGLDTEAPAAIDDAIAGETISRPHARRIVDAAYTVGVEQRLQLAATHVAGRDVGDCATKTKATVALSTLTVEQADRVEAWIAKKADEQAASAAETSS